LSALTARILLLLTWLLLRILLAALLAALTTLAALLAALILIHIRHCKTSPDHRGMSPQKCNESQACSFRTLGRNSPAI
jgi:hypothetical protein